MKKLFLILTTVAAIAVCGVCAACSPKIADNTEHFDKITKTLKLSKSYEDKKLMSDDGIEKATLIGDTTDGDTSGFRLAGGGSVTVRYQGVDTPESTAGVEKWGKAASIFTNERLHLATEIVIESASGGVPDKDSVGGRPLCYVWYKTAQDDFKCLNLELVENGYSTNKESATNGYYGYFQKAERFAKSIKLRLFSDLDDPLFNTAVQDISLKSIAEEPTKFSENMKVRLLAFIQDTYTSTSGAVTHTIAQYDEASGKTYTLPLYAGYKGAATSMRIGDLYQIVGTLQKHDGNWQISGVTVDNDRKGDSEISWRSQLSYALKFDDKDQHFADKLNSNFFGNIAVRSFTLEGTKLTFKGSALKTDDTTSDFTFTVTVPENYDGEIKEGSVLTVSVGYQLEAASGQVVIPNYSYISIIGFELETAS